MTVKEMMDVLSQLDPSKEVYVWSSEWDMNVPVNSIDVDQDGEVVIGNHVKLLTQKINGVIIHI